MLMRPPNVTPSGMCNPTLFPEPLRSFLIFFYGTYSHVCCRQLENELTVPRRTALSEQQVGNREAIRYVGVLFWLVGTHHHVGARIISLWASATDLQESVYESRRDQAAAVV